MVDRQFSLDGEYLMEGRTEEKRAIRPLLYEDRVLPVEQKFFCDRTTEKTIILTVTDYDNTPKVMVRYLGLLQSQLSCTFQGSFPPVHIFLNVWYPSALYRKIGKTASVLSISSKMI